MFGKIGKYHINYRGADAVKEQEYVDFVCDKYAFVLNQASDDRDRFCVLDVNRGSQAIATIRRSSRGIWDLVKCEQRTAIAYVRDFVMQLNQSPPPSSTELENIRETLIHIKHLQNLLTLTVTDLIEEMKNQDHSKFSETELKELYQLTPQLKATIMDLLAMICDWWASTNCHSTANTNKRNKG